MSEDDRKKWRCTHFCKNSKKSTTLPGNEDITGFDIQKTTTLLESLNTKVANFETVVNTVQTSQELLSVKYDELLKEIKGLRDENKKLTCDISELKKQLASKDNVIDNLNMQINNDVEYVKRNNLEIHCLETSSRPPIEDLQVIAEKIDVNFQMSDVSGVHRLPIRKPTDTHGEKSPVSIVQFVSKLVRSDWLTRGRAAKLTNKVVGNKSEKRIYFNENLTAFNKRLFMQAKLKAKPLEYKYMWTSQGRVLVRKEHHAQIIRIKSFMDLDKIVQ
ncbi:uncharacterized protein LOC111057055 [Nilaparvata lugens]|uniref:uncharacterized protein LOC111057055 n=1 Tax=Nilaparvata lugens TaxID=108931 RepID=UPI00193DB2AD|nr:uncharacterized protein LOC111057055 [Nilaparvata lugens]